MNHYEFIHNYINRHVDKFNKELFKRSDDAIIDQVEKIIMSCQTEGLFSIRVDGFTVLEDYNEIRDTLRDYYDAAKRTSRSTRRGDDDNRFNYIDLKESDIKLLIAHYTIGVKGETDTAKVLIEIPRVVNKFYFYINGNYYSPLYQIVDSSTYNNSAAKIQRFPAVTLKTNFQPIRMYRKEYKVKTTQGDVWSLIHYECNIFSKTVPTANYIFAKYGMVRGLQLMGLDSYFYISDTDTTNEFDISFTTKSKNKSNPIYIKVPKMVLEKNHVAQHILYTLITSPDTHTTVADLFTREFWISKLGARFSTSNKLDKGLSVINSLESILDINIQEQIHLPWEIKKDIYSIFIWMMAEHSMLRLKDNFNIANKKLRCAEYIAAMYANKLSSGIYRLCSIGKRIDIKSIKKVIYTKPDFLITELSKSQLISFRNIVNDMDSFLPLKFTYKGISGIGESSSSIPDQFRLLDISHMGILDPDASSPSDPGITGSIVPYLNIQRNGYFTKEQEPTTWIDEVMNLAKEYKKAKGLQEALEFDKNVLNKEVSNEDIFLASQSVKILSDVKTELATQMETNDQILKKHIDSITGIPLEEGGVVTYE